MKAMFDCLMTDKPFAFVLMPFDFAMNDVYKLGIKAAVENSGMIAERVDEQVFHREGILDRIYNQITAADLIIADMSGRNPNVFYEVGYAHAKGKLCILLTSKAEDIPFDLKHHRHIIYSSIQQLKETLTSDLSFVKLELEQRENPIFVELRRSSSTLVTTKYSATGSIEFTFDLHNRTQQTSPEIDSIFFHCGSGWTFKQDGRPCPSTKSDLPAFNERHLINPPTRRLPKNGWNQFKITGTKVLAWATKGEELKESYKITGTAHIQVQAGDHLFDYPMTIEAEFDDIPF